MSAFRAAVLLLSMLPASAFAHAHLLTPTPRNTAANKTGPCGVARTASATSFAPGQTITVTWAETINHPGSYRIAFSPSGDTGFDTNVLLNNIPNPAGLQANNSATVTLPTTPCTQCTLQLIQVMTDSTPPSNYYSCADITIGTPTNTPPTIAQAAAAAPATVATTSTQLTALGADNAGEAALRYTWAMASGPAAVTFSANGTNAAKSSTATFTRAGSYALTVTVADAASLTATSTVNVTVNATLTSMQVAPATASVATSASRQFTATAVDQFATALATQPAITWTVSGGGTVTAAGRFTAGTATGGPHTLTASGGGRSGTAAITIVTASPPTVMTPAAATPPAAGAATVALSALGSDAAGEPALLYTWAATTAPAPVTFSANGTNAAKSVVATLTQAGAYTFEVTIRNGASLTVTSNVSITVTPALTAVAVTPVSSSVPLGGMLAFAGTASDQFGSALVPQPTLTWTVSGGGTISAAGVFVAGTTAGGPFTVTAASGGKQGTASVTITPMDAPRVVQAASALPATVTGTTAVLRVLGGDDMGEAGLTYTWSAKTAPAAVTFSANTTNAAKEVTVTFARAGLYQLEVELKDGTAKTAVSGVMVTVTQTLARIDVSPAEGSVLPGEELRFIAAGADQFNLPLAAQPTYSWSVTGPLSISAEGVVTAGAVPGGPYTVAAQSSSRIGTALVTVTAPEKMDLQAPVVSMRSPTDGERVAGTVELSATATDDTGVVDLWFTLDGEPLTRVTAAPWVASWDSTRADDGEYSVAAVARDAAGNVTTSPAVKLQVQNHGERMAGGCAAVGGDAAVALALALLALTRRRT